MQSINAFYFEVKTYYNIVMKTTYKDIFGNFHFGISAPNGYSQGIKQDIKDALTDLGERKLWRCNVCNDLRISKDPLRECPTCFAKDAYVEIDLNEFNKLLEIL
jgi:rubrerythrin